MSEMLSLHQLWIQWRLCEMRERECELSFPLAQRDNENETEKDEAMILNFARFFLEPQAPQRGSKVSQGHPNPSSLSVPCHKSVKYNWTPAPKEHQKQLSVFTPELGGEEEEQCRVSLLPFVRLRLFHCSCLIAQPFCSTEIQIHPKFLKAKWNFKCFSVSL